jgi:hypothetical protein
VDLHWCGRLSEVRDEVFERWELGVDFAFWMRFREELLWGLTKVVDDVDAGEPFDRVRDLFQVDRALVGEMMEYVYRFDRCFASLFVPKYEVDPFLY